MYSNIEQDKQYHLLDFLENKYGESDQLVTQLKHFLNAKHLMNDLRFMQM